MLYARRRHCASARILSVGTPPLSCRLRVARNRLTIILLPVRLFAISHTHTHKWRCGCARVLCSGASVHTVRDVLHRDIVCRTIIYTGWRTHCIFNT